MDEGSKVTSCRPEDVSRLLSAARAGSRSALGRLLDCYRQLLWAIAANSIRGPLQYRVRPSDVVQDTLLDAARDFDLFRSNEEVAWRAWLCRLMRNNLIGLQRHHTQQKRQITREQIRIDHFLETPIPDHRSTPFTHLAKIERTARIQQAVDQLPMHYRQIVLAHLRDGHSLAKIADNSGRTRESVKMLWLRALAAC